MRTAFLAIAACVVGVGSWMSIEGITGVEAWDHPYYWLYGYPVLLITSFATALVDGRKPFLWGALPLLSQAAYVLYGASSTAALLPLTLVLYAVLFVPCLLSAYAGVYLRRRSSFGKERLL
jgi:hypothetical protein